MKTTFFTATFPNIKQNRNIKNLKTQNRLLKRHWNWTNSSPHRIVFICTCVGSARFSSKCQNIGINKPTIVFTLRTILVNFSSLSKHTIVLNHKQQHQFSYLFTIQHVSNNCIWHLEGRKSGWLHIYAMQRLWWCHWRWHSTWIHHGNRWRPWCWQNTILVNLLWWSFLLYIFTNWITFYWFSLFKMSKFTVVCKRSAAEEFARFGWCSCLHWHQSGVFHQSDERYKLHS